MARGRDRPSGHWHAQTVPTALAIAGEASGCKCVRQIGVPIRQRCRGDETAGSEEQLRDERCWWSRGMLMLGISHFVLDKDRATPTKDAQSAWRVPVSERCRRLTFWTPGCVAEWIARNCLRETWV